MEQCDLLTQFTRLTHCEQMLSVTYGLIDHYINNDRLLFMFNYIRDSLHKQGK